MTGPRGLEQLADIRGQHWREQAACNSSGVEFVDVGAEAGRDLIRTYCWACPVVGPCREEGDRMAPHDWPTVMGARLYGKREPVDGWPDIEEAS